MQQWSTRHLTLGMSPLPCGNIAGEALQTPNLPRSYLVQVQPADQFYRNKHTTDKLESQCKQCKRSALQNVTTPTVEQKKCSKCNEVRPAGCFDRYKRTSDGLQSQCKDCMKVRHVRLASVCPGCMPTTVAMPLPVLGSSKAYSIQCDLLQQSMPSAAAESSCRPAQAARPVVKQPTVVEKPCSKCHVLKAASEFFRREQSHDGLQSWCRACKNAARQAQVRCCLVGCMRAEDPAIGRAIHFVVLRPYPVENAALPCF